MGKILELLCAIPKTDRPIIVGNHVWIAAEVTHLKGSSVADDCIIGFGSIILKQYEEENSLLVGAPAKSVKKNIEWKH